MEGNNHIRHIDELGRVVIPANFRRALNLEADSPVYVSLHDNSITIRGAINKCALCGSQDNLQNVGDKHLCQSCIDFINQNFSK